MKEKNRRKNQKGITLIALVITIIIMLILVAVTVKYSISSGLLSKSKEGTADYKFREEEDEIGAIKLAYKVDKETGENIEEFDKYLEDALTGEAIIENDGSNLKITYKGSSKSHIVPIQIEKDKSYIGCYADIDGNGSVDGIIYADLAKSKCSIWSEGDNRWNNYEYFKQDNLKEYYIIEKDHSQVWGEGTKVVTADVVAPVDGTIGNDRFYVMELDEFIYSSLERFYWYFNATSKLDRYVTYDCNDFGKGKKNTIDMLNDWNNKTDIYGAQTKVIPQYGTVDLWSAIQDGQYDLVKNENDSKKWFVPSKAEWSAFGDYLHTYLGVTINNCSEFGFDARSGYWTSSQKDKSHAFKASITSKGSITYEYVNNCAYNVRLSITF